MSSTPSARGGALEAERHFLRELVVGALRRIAEPVELLLERPQRTAVEVLADLVDHAAALERVEQPERHALRQAAPGRDLAQRQRLARRSKRRQQAGRMDDRLHQVRIARGCFTAHRFLFRSAKRLDGSLARLRSGAAKSARQIRPCFRRVQVILRQRANWSKPFQRAKRRRHRRKRLTLPPTGHTSVALT